MSSEAAVCIAPLWWLISVQVTRPASPCQWMGKSKTKQSQYTSDNFFPKVVCIILDSSCHANTCASVHFSDKIDFKQLFDDIFPGKDGLRLAATGVNHPIRSRSSLQTRHPKHCFTSYVTQTLQLSGPGLYRRTAIKKDIVMINVCEEVMLVGDLSGKFGKYVFYYSRYNVIGSFVKLLCWLASILSTASLRTDSVSWNNKIHIS